MSNEVLSRKEIDLKRQTVYILDDGEVISNFSQGEPTDPLGPSFYVVEDGLVVLEKSTPDGRAGVIYSAHPGDVFGLEDLDQKTHSLSARSWEDGTRVRRIPIDKAKIEELLPKIADAIARAETVSDVMKLGDLRQKLAFALLDLADSSNEVNQTIKRIAFRADGSREDSGSILARFAERNAIVPLGPNRKGIRIIDPIQIQKIAGIRVAGR